MTFHWVNGVTVSAQYHSICHFIAVPHTQHQLSLIWVKTGSLLMINPPPPLTSRNEIADTALYLHLSMSCHSWRSNRPRFHPWQLPASSGNRWVQHSGMDVWFPALSKSCQSVVAKVCRSYEWHITAAHDLSGDVCPKGRPALTQPFTAEDNEQASAMFEGPACPRQAEHRRNDNYTHSSPHCIVDHLFVKHWSVV